MILLDELAQYNPNLFAVTPGSNLIELLQFPFMQRAIAGGVLMGCLGGLLGSFVTLRQLSFFSHAVGHSALVGIVLGVLLQLNPTWMLLPFTVAFGLIVLYLIDQTDLASDNILNVVLSGTLAVGIILSGLIRGYRGGLMNVLFGDILAIDLTDIVLTVLLLLSAAIYLLSTLQQQILLTLNLSVAKVQGIPVQLHRYLFVVLLSLTVALATKAVGILLVNAFLVIPASAAKLLSHQFSHFLAISVILGVFSSIFGLLLSGLLNWASGPSIVLIQFLVFLAVIGFSKLKIQQS
ncbi:metal ABC transporter permease [Aerosakkonema funiforme]|uniref:Metal ABC transporter permease n=1 Tax=Aerosakkonema funiforme FACHB-1375 TaxID=2949571 RepID=A0A926VL84_9CYAN|nr:metal ABC transporter permease [Aerosakkonema funiforme]MBD2184499.1 metal ABC transporter permease [Aerosakkonema funiforme FACHB-1375]